MHNLIELFQGIYPDWLRTRLTFLVPVAFAVTIPFEVLAGGLNNQTLLAVVLLALGLLLISRWF